MECIHEFLRNSMEDFLKESQDKFLKKGLSKFKKKKLWRSCRRKFDNISRDASSVTIRKIREISYETRCKEYLK